MNAAKWNAKYPVGTHVVVSVDGIKRIKESYADLGLSDDGRTVTIDTGAGGAAPEGRAAVDYAGRTFVYLKGVCGWTPIEFVEPCDPPSPEQIAESEKRAWFAALATDLAEDARAGRWAEVKAKIAAMSDRVMS